MHITKLSAALLGLVALASAAPHPQSEVPALDRRMKWTPRSVEVVNLNSGGSNNEKDGNKNKGDMNKGKNNHKDDHNGGNRNDRESVTIIDTTVIELNEQRRNSEVELTVLVEEKIRIDRSCKRAKDNIRKNHYRNKNRNQNTIIVVITQIIDIRDSNNRNTRYMRHQLRADNGSKNEVIVQVTEVEVITIDNRRGKGNGRKGSRTQAAGEIGTAGNVLAATAASEAVANAIQTVDPNAPFQATNQTMLLPSGAPAPSNANLDLDPAAIIEPNRNDMFVQVVS